MKFLVLLLVGSLSFNVLADSTKKKIEVDIEQLKQNAENSNENLDQYVSNMKTVEKNIVEVNKAIKNLNDYKRQIASSIQNSDKNKAKLSEQKVKIASYIKKEEGSIFKEQQQIKALQEKIASIQKNIDNRKLNISAYEKKNEEIDLEIKDWDNQLAKIKELKTVVSNKEKNATKEQKEWLAKKSTYSKEITKWRKQANYDEDLYRKYNKMK